MSSNHNTWRPIFIILTHLLDGGQLHKRQQLRGAAVRESLRQLGQQRREAPEVLRQLLEVPQFVTSCTRDSPGGKLLPVRETHQAEVLHVGREGRRRRHEGLHVPPRKLEAARHVPHGLALPRGSQQQRHVHAPQQRRGHQLKHLLFTTGDMSTFVSYPGHGAGHHGGHSTLRHPYQANGALVGRGQHFELKQEYTTSSLGRSYYVDCVLYIYTLCSNNIYL